VLAVLAIVVAFVLLVGFAIHKMNPDKLRIYGESKLAKFGLEIGRSGQPRGPDEPGNPTGAELPHVPELPREERRELEV
jgi:hypothetical protein